MNGPMRIYHNDMVFRVVAGLLLGVPGALMAAFGLVLGFSGDSAALAVVGCAVAMLWMAGETVTRYVRLTEESIETGTMFSSRALGLDEIAGKRIVRGRFLGILLYSSKPGRARLSIGGGLDFDAAFWSWLETGPAVSTPPVAGRTP